MVENHSTLSHLILVKVSWVFFHLHLNMYINKHYIHSIYSYMYPRQYLPDLIYEYLYLHSLPPLFVFLYYKTVIYFITIIFMTFFLAWSTQGLQISFCSSCIMPLYIKKIVILHASVARRFKSFKLYNKEVGYTSLVRILSGVIDAIPNEILLRSHWW